jgi:hypothetical protein
MLTNEGKFHSNGNQGLSIPQSHGIICIGMLDGVLSQICSGRSRVNFPAIEDAGTSECQTRLSGYLAVIHIGLLFVTVSQRPKRQRLVPGIPMVAGSDIQHVKQSRKRFIHDGHSMLAEGYREVR